MQQRMSLSDKIELEIALIQSQLQVTTQEMHIKHLNERLFGGSEFKTGERL
jgi:hypothetical protein